MPHIANIYFKHFNVDLKVFKKCFVMYCISIPNYHFQPVFFILLHRSEFLLLSFPFKLKNSFSITCNVSLLETNFLSFF